MKLKLPSLLLSIVPLLLLSRLLPAADPLPIGAPQSLSATDWPWWRGLHRNGHAPADQNPPLKWSEKENIVWKAPIAGRGYGSPIVVGDAVYLATADEAAQTRSLVCIDRTNGRQRWECVVHQGSPTPPTNKKGTQASSTPACDGERLFINFLHDGGMVTSAVSLEGELLWQQRITEYVVHQGFGSSPAVYDRLVIVSADNKSGGAIAGLDRKSGQIVWQQDRPETPNYPSPIVLEIAGRPQVLMTGCDLVAAFDPLSGERLWQIEGATTECVTSTVTDGERIYSTGGYPRNHVAAIAADGSGAIAWQNTTRVYVPSMLVKDGYLYAVADAGVAVCWKSDTGQEQWKGRLGGTFSSSPVLVGDRIYVTNEAGESFVYRATPDEFELLGKSDLGDECFATPAIVGGRIYTRIARMGGGKRQEHLYCIGK
jgi:outer membrane protein assembly factor BamB